MKNEMIELLQVMGVKTNIRQVGQLEANATKGNMEILRGIFTEENLLVVGKKVRIEL